MKAWDDPRGGGVLGEIVDSSVMETQPLLAERFQILEVLGQGGASLVYRARDRQQNDRECALKVLVETDAFDEHIVERFREELRTCQEVHHHNIVHGFDLIELDGMLAMTMEYVPGKDLSALFTTRKFSADESVHIVSQVLAALEALHAHGVVHRDIKLENIMFCEGGLVKVSDLGLMKSPSLQALTKPGILLGTVQYMPPEYVLEGEYEKVGDIYATGVVLLELLTGKRRLVNLRGAEAVDHLVQTRFEISDLTLADIPARLLPVLVKSLERDPTKRFQTAREFRQALGRACVGDPAGVELRPRMSLELAHRAAAVHQRPSVAWNFVAVSLASALVVVMGFVAQMYLTGMPQLAPGRYKGEVVMGARVSKPYLVAVDASLTKQGTILTFEDPVAGCKSATLHLESGTFYCDGEKVRSPWISMANDRLQAVIGPRADHLVQLTPSPSL
jgi:serine/threonine-protein kinase